jgi:amino acid transporter
MPPPRACRAGAGHGTLRRRATEALAGASVIVLRRRMPEAPRPCRVPGYPWVPLFFVATSSWFVAMTLVAKPAQAWAGIAFLGLGVPVYYLWKRTAPEASHDR